jgi:hypothetical protein
MATATRTVKEPGTIHEAPNTNGRPTGNASVLRPIIGDAIEAALHSYEQVVANMCEFEHKTAASLRSERAKAALNLHATFVEDLTTVYVRTARAALR